MQLPPPRMRLAGCCWEELAAPGICITRGKGEQGREGDEEGGGTDPSGLAGAGLEQRFALRGR